MTDQTPRTEAGRRLIRELYDGDPYFMEQVIAIEAEAAAQARTEGLDRVLAFAETYDEDDHPHASNALKDYIRAILAGETE